MRSLDEVQPNGFSKDEILHGPLASVGWLVESNHLAFDKVISAWFRRIFSSDSEHPQWARQRLSVTVLSHGIFFGATHSVCLPLQSHPHHRNARSRSRHLLLLCCILHLLTLRRSTSSWQPAPAPGCVKSTGAVQHHHGTGSPARTPV